MGERKGRERDLGNTNWEEHLEKEILERSSWQGTLILGSFLLLRSLRRTRSLTSITLIRYVSITVCPVTFAFYSVLLYTFTNCNFSNLVLSQFMASKLCGGPIMQLIKCLFLQFLCRLFVWLHHHFSLVQWLVNSDRNTTYQFSDIFFMADKEGDIYLEASEAP